MLRKIFVGIIFIIFILSTDAFSLAKEEVISIIDKIEKSFEIPQVLLHSIVWQESSYRIRAFNSSENPGVSISSYGLGQLTLDTARHHCKLGKKYILDPVKNIKCSAKVLSYQLKRYQNNIKSAVAAYNWGTPCVCNGVNFVKRISGKIKMCYRKAELGRLIPLTCREKGLFWNQDYVDGVLTKRKILKKKFEKEKEKELLIKKEKSLVNVPTVNKENDLNWILGKEILVPLGSPYLKAFN
jgi:hypothetical protein